jgi:phosphopantothenoylcysteine decarboxylase/phosphopantothenate--cysteine ligase
LFISTAAVADFKVINAQSQKIKKDHSKNMSLSLEKNEDILKYVSDNNPNLKIVGFAAETENMIDNARKKLFSKNLNLIVANDVSDSSIGFDSNNNEVTLISKKEELKILKTSKEKVARKIVQFISKNILND